MPPDDNTPEDKSKRKDRSNPWNKPQGSDNKPTQGPWGSPPSQRPSGSYNSAQDNPDFEEMMRRLQLSLQQMLPANMQGYPVAALGGLLVIILWLASGLYVVNPGDHAVIQRFGAWNRTQSEPGLGYHLPTPFESDTIVNVQQIRRLGIGFADTFGRSGATEKRGLPEESLMLTSDRNIVDLDLEVQWNVKNSEDFLFNIEDQEGTIKKVAESAIREIVGQTPMFQIITNQREQVADRTRTIIQQNLDQYKSGVNITQVLIQKAEVHPDVQDAFQDVQSAKQDAEDVQNRASAYREDILPKARGQAIQMTQQAEAYKRSTVDKAKGDGDRFNSILAAYQNGKDVTRERMYLETMEEVLKNAKKIILDSKNSQGVVPYLPLNSLSGPKVPAPAAATDETKSNLQ
jgi:membrane protease subunit HflK